MCAPVVLEQVRRDLSRRRFLGAGKYGVELVANLGAVPPTGATVFVGAMKHEGATGAPARVIAVVRKSCCAGGRPGGCYGPL